MTGWDYLLLVVVFLKEPVNQCLLWEQCMGNSCFSAFPHVRWQPDEVSCCCIVSASMAVVSAFTDADYITERWNVEVWAMAVCVCVWWCYVEEWQEDDMQQVCSTECCDVPHLASWPADCVWHSWWQGKDATAAAVYMLNFTLAAKLCPLWAVQSLSVNQLCFAHYSK